MDHTKTNSTPTPSVPSSLGKPTEVGDGFIPFTEAQLTTLTSRQSQYFTEARNKLNYDIELAGQLDDRVKSAIQQGKRVRVDLERAGFVCE